MKLNASQEFAMIKQIISTIKTTAILAGDIQVLVDLTNFLTEEGKILAEEIVMVKE